MIEINYKNKVEETKSWEFFFTPFGSITVIKTLLIPKLDHIIGTIPKPCQSMINSPDKNFNNFLWKCS